ncbi:uncharacterized protein A4U43_C03F18340 [Asparagus officinalis]|uniref:Uncharacterized protein n=1 Tax=Asparagus officinalis TaxID=4686 RepID=A0A5P1FC13_ASPOF|nr:uncharacterized protein A4U43_C03F18340 [Asparagus officinalis]
MRGDRGLGGGQARRRRRREGERAEAHRGRVGGSRGGGGMRGRRQVGGRGRGGRPRAEAGRRGLAVGGGSLSILGTISRSRAPCRCCNGAGVEVRVRGEEGGDRGARFPSKGTAWRFCREDLLRDLRSFEIDGGVSSSSALRGFSLLRQDLWWGVGGGGGG